MSVGVLLAVVFQSTVETGIEREFAYTIWALVFVVGVLVGYISHVIHTR